MTFKKFLHNIDNIYAEQGDKPKSERLRYGQIIMNELHKVWPEKYQRITGSDKDPFYSHDKKAYDFLYHLEEAWPACPANLNKDQVRVQRLEKKIKKLQASNKRHKEDIKYYKRILRDFPWVEPGFKSKQENIELTKNLKEKNWALRGAHAELNTVNLITDHDMECLQALSKDLEKLSVNDNNIASAPHLLERLIAVLKSMKNNARNRKEL